MKPSPKHKVARFPSLVPFASSRDEFIQAAFLGRMTAEDMAYMGRAILQMADENAELKERVRALEMAFAELNAHPARKPR